MWNNYFSLIDGIKEVSLHHTEEFYEGDVYEYLNNGTHKYPSVILTVQSVDTTDSINTVSATLFCVDRLTDNSDNKLEVQSLCMTKLLKILNSLEENVHNVVSNTFTPFTEKFADLCGGMFVEFSFQYVGESLCDDLEIKEIELTQNGIYDVIGYDRAIVNVIPEVNLEDITITDNGEYTCGDGFDGFGKVNVDVQPPKLKLSLLEVSKNSGINAEGRWDYDTLLDTSDVTSFANMFYGSTNLKTIDVSNWDTSKVTNIGSMFYGCTNLKEVKGMDNFDVSKVTNCTSPLRNTAVEIIDLNKWDVSNWTKMDEIFREVKATHIYVDKWNTSNVTSFQNAFLYCQKLQYLDITNWDFSSATTVFQMFQTTPIKNFIGDRTIEEVLANNISVFKGLKVGFTTNQSVIDRATLRAMINGVADLTGQTSQTLSIGSVNMKRLTEEDIAIATAKNWSIA